MSGNCQKYFQDFQKLIDLKTDIDRDISWMINNLGTHHPVYQNFKWKKLDIEYKTDDLYLRLVREAYVGIDIKKNYIQQIQILADLGIITRNNRNRLVLKAANSREYPVPEFNDILKAFRKHHSKIITSSGPSYRDFVIVPFGKDISELMKKFVELLNAQKENTIHYDKISGKVSYENMISNTTDIIYPDETIGRAYYDRGQNKNVLLAERNNAWEIALFQHPNLTVEEYVEESDLFHKQELFMRTAELLPERAISKPSTPEAWLSRAIYRLANIHKQDVPDLRNNKGIIFLGSYLPAKSTPGKHQSGFVSLDWEKENNRLLLDVKNPKISYAGEYTPKRVCPTYYSILL